MNRLLIVEDSVEYQRLLEMTLRSGFILTFASTVKGAIELLNANDYELVVLDIMLPDGDGYAVCSAMQKSERLKRVPVIFLTAKNLLSDKLLGFTLGADDYLTKPFEPLELRVRIETKLKRQAETRQEAEILRKANLTLDMSLQRAFVHEGAHLRDLDLTSKEFKLLCFLVRSEGRILNRDDLLSRVWGDEINVSDRTVDTHISKVRKKLGDKADYIKAVYGSGYYFSVVSSSKNAGATTLLKGADKASFKHF